MSIPAPEPLPPPPARKEPYFKGAFFWYVVLQVAFSVAFVMTLFVYFFVVGVVYANDPGAIEPHLEFGSEAAQPVASILTIALCITVARRHKTGFGRGILLFFAGNIIAVAICIPLIAVITMGGEDGGLGWLASLLLIMLIYGIGCIVIIVRRRRQTAASRLRRDAIAQFD